LTTIVTTTTIVTMVTVGTTAVTTTMVTVTTFGLNETGAKWVNSGYNPGKPKSGGAKCLQSGVKFGSVRRVISEGI
jgi:hypothetical protein